MCDRCFKKTTTTTGSYFNLQMICMDCYETEKKNPRYEEARRIENEQVLKGNYNFKGIGL